MGAGDKIRSAAESAGGKVKKAAGAATGNESLRAEGQAERHHRQRSAAEPHHPRLAAG